MEFNRFECSDAGNFAIATFTDEEAEVIRATYNEKIQACVLLGNTESVSDFDRFMATYGQGATREVKLKDPDGLVRSFTEFYENTDDALIDLAHARIPAYLNEHITKRYRLGEQAVELSQRLVKQFPTEQLSSVLETPAPDHVPLDWENPGK